MMYIAEVSAGDGLVAGGLGLVSLLTVLQMIFKKRGDDDPDSREAKQAIKAIEAIVGQTAVAVATIEQKVTAYNSEFQKQVTVHAIEYQRTLDSINAINTTLHSRIDQIDSTVRGNGKEGLTEIAARHEVELKAFRQRMDDIHKEIERISTRIIAPHSPH